MNFLLTLTDANPGIDCYSILFQSSISPMEKSSAEVVLEKCSFIITLRVQMIKFDLFLESRNMH